MHVAITNLSHSRVRFRRSRVDVDLADESQINASAVGESRHLVVSISRPDVSGSSRIFQRNAVVGFSGSELEMLFAAAIVNSVVKSPLVDELASVGSQLRKIVEANDEDPEAVRQKLLSVIDFVDNAAPKPKPPMTWDEWTASLQAGGRAQKAKAKRKRRAK